MLVAFGSSSKRHSKEEEAVLLARRVEQLSQQYETLEEKLRWTEGRYAQSVSLGKELNQALLQEKQKSTNLAEELRRQMMQQQAQASQSPPEPPGS